MRAFLAAIPRVFTFSPLATAIGISAVILSPMAWTLPMVSQPDAIKKDQARVAQERDLATVPVLYTREDPWTVHVIPTISYRGDHYEKKPRRSADDSEQLRIEQLKNKAPNAPKTKDKKRSDIAPSALLAYAKADIGKRGPQLGLPSSLWCMDFVNRVLKLVGLPTTGSRMARSPLTHPNFVRVAKPAPGDIVVISRGRSSVYGHVALYNGSCGKGGIRMLGGNQRGGRVTDDCVYGRAVVGYVRPKAIANDNVQVAANDNAPAKVTKLKVKKRYATRYAKRYRPAARHATVEKPAKPMWAQEG